MAESPTAKNLYRAVLDRVVLGVCCARSLEPLLVEAAGFAGVWWDSEHLRFDWWPVTRAEWRESDVEGTVVLEERRLLHPAVDGADDWLDRLYRLTWVLPLECEVHTSGP